MGVRGRYSKWSCLETVPLFIKIIRDSWSYNSADDATVDTDATIDTDATVDTDATIDTDATMSMKAEWITRS